MAKVYGQIVLYGTVTSCGVRPQKLKDGETVEIAYAEVQTDNGKVTWQKWREDEYTGPQKGEVAYVRVIGARAFGGALSVEGEFLGPDEVNELLTTLRALNPEPQPALAGAGKGEKFG